VAEWSIAADCKSVASCFVGSNPILPIFSSFSIVFLYSMNFNIVSKYYQHELFACNSKGKGLRSKAGFFFFPIFNRNVFYFRLPYAAFATSKKNRNINSTVWFHSYISKTHFLFIVPVYSNYIVFF
jgi:hypothetical protein